MPTGLRSIPLKAARAALLTAVIGLVASTAAAEDRAAEAPAGQPLVVLSAPEIAGSDVDDRAVGMVEVHVGVGVRLRTVRHDSSALDPRKLLADSQALIKAWDARGVIWIDVGQGSEAGVYLVERDSNKVYGRRVPAPSGKTSAMLEDLANIASSAATELIEGRVIGMASIDVAAASPEAPPAPTPAREEEKAKAPSSVSTPASAPSKAPSRTRLPAPSAPQPAKPAPAASQAEAGQWPRLGLAAGYMGNTFGREIPWQSAVSILASWELSPLGYIGLGYDIVIPQRVGDERARIELVRHPIIAMGAYRLGLTPRWGVQVGARATMDFMTRVPDIRSSGPPGAPQPQPGPPPESTTDVVFSVAPVLGTAVQLTDRVRAGALLGLDIVVSQPSSGPAPLLQSSAVRFLAGASLEIDLIVPGASGSSSASTAAAKR